MATREDMGEIYDRLRETEAQTREQNERIAALTKQVGAMSEKWDKHMDRMWKLVYILVSALVALALGPKVAEKIVSQNALASSYHIDIIPWHGEPPAPAPAKA